jgi:hypothetical protein
MNTMRRLARLRGHKGSAIIFVAVTLMVLVAFAGLAIDVGYLYVVRGELQNAADSGALAGAQKLYDTSTFPMFVNPLSYNSALDYVQQNYSEKAQTEIVSIDRGHWSFATKEFTADNRILEVPDLWKVTTEQLDAMDGKDGRPMFVNAVRVITKRKRAAIGDTKPPAPFFIGVVNNQAAEVRATAVAYIGYAGSLAPGEVDQPIALCQDKLELADPETGIYNCNTGRMLSDPIQTARWTDYTQPESGQCLASDRDLKDILTRPCDDHGNPVPLILGQTFATTNGTQANSIRSMEGCWRSSAPDSDHDGIPDGPWTISLPVVNGPCGGGGCVFKLIGAVTVNVLWITPNGNDPHFHNVPRKMSNLDNNINWVCSVPGDTDAERQQCWTEFVEAFSILNTAGVPATVDDYRSDSFYFMPACYAHELGGTGGQNFGVLARIPVLVK